MGGSMAEDKTLNQGPSAYPLAIMTFRSSDVLDGKYTKESTICEIEFQADSSQHLGWWGTLLEHEIAMEQQPGP